MRLGPAVAISVLLSLAGCGGDSVPWRAQFLDAFAWHGNEDWFGGFSGIEVTDDGQKMTLITDQGRLVTARINRDGDTITGISSVSQWHLKTNIGRLMKPGVHDTEGLATGPDGTIFLALEAVHLIARLSAPTVNSVPMKRHPAFRTFSSNGSLEALAIDGGGRLFTLPEDKPNADGSLPVYRWNGASWSQPFDLPSDGKFLPVGADFGPDGRFYLLERAFGVRGFRTRVRSWAFTETAAQDEQTLLETRFGTHDNLEGLAVWRDEAGRLRLTMVSDDNFMFFQTTEIVEYAVTE